MNLTYANLFWAFCVFLTPILVSARLMVDDGKNKFSKIRFKKNKKQNPLSPIGDDKDVFDMTMKPTGFELTNSQGNKISISKHETVNIDRLYVKDNVNVNSSNIFPWKVVFEDHFETEFANYSFQDVSNCHNQLNIFLGGPCLLGGQKSVRKTAELPFHRFVRLRGLVHFFDKWKNNQFAIKIDGTPVKALTHSWCTKKNEKECFENGINVCGNLYPDRMSNNFDVIVAHSKSTIEIEFSTDLNETDNCLASWGLDDISLTIA